MLFSELLLKIDKADLRALCDAGYPETDQVEYKEFLPEKTGRDAWHTEEHAFSRALQRATSDKPKSISPSA